MGLPIFHPGKSTGLVGWTTPAVRLVPEFFELFWQCWKGGGPPQHPPGRRLYLGSRVSFSLHSHSDAFCRRFFFVARKCNEFPWLINQTARHGVTDGILLGSINLHLFAGLITTTSRKLDREQQDEHILEVSLPLFLITSEAFTS